jgi:hypothetical protein
MGWKDNAVGIDVSSAQTGLDWSVVSADFAMVKMGETNRDSGVVDYDQQFAIHVQGAYDNNIPVGAYFVPDPEINGHNQVTLDAYRTGLRNNDPEYKFIRSTLQNKSVQFIAIVFAHASADPVWNDANLEYLVNALQSGMTANELPNIPIVLCANEDFVNKNFFYNKTNTFFDFVARHESPTLRVWSLSNVAGLAVPSNWQDVKNHLPADTQKPTYLNSTKYQPLFWQYTIDKMPMNKANQTVAFGMDVSTMQKTALYTWMNFVGNETPPPVNTTCPIGQHWDTTQNKCVDDTVVTPPVVTGDLATVITMLTKLQATLDRIFK